MLKVALNTMNRTDFCVWKTGVKSVQVKINKDFLHWDLYKVWFIQDLYKVWFIQDLYKVWFIQDLYKIWFIQDLYKVWFIQDSILFKALFMFRQVSP